MMRGYCVPGIINLRNLNTNDSIVVESCTMRLHLRHTPVHTLFITQDSPPIDFSRHGPSLLPSLLTHSLRAHSSSSSSPSSSSPLPFFPSSSVEVCEGRLVTQRGYSPEDIGAVAELRETLERHRAFGLDRWDLVTSHTHLAEPRDGRTRGLQQYIQVETLKHTAAAVHTGRDALKHTAAAVHSGRDTLKHTAAAVHTGRDTLKHTAAAVHSGRDTLKHTAAAVHTGRDTLKHTAVAVHTGRDTLKHTAAAVHRGRDTLKHTAAAVHTGRDTLKHTAAAVHTGRHAETHCCSSTYR
uniref:Uncharacterized protein n=1 Tax=Hucho hucho TaxID=62062 RepID=A0A4W5KWM6_9TELE